MNQYKVVKEVGYTAVYTVYRRKLFFFWSEVDCFGAISLEDAEKRARSRVIKTEVFFEA
jgi:hypothetical protein